MEDKKGRKTRISKRMDYLPSVFYQKERISIFILNMNHNNANDRKKLRRMIYDYYGGLRYYISKNRIDTSGYDKLNDEIVELDIFDDSYVDKLIQMSSEATNIAGLAGLLPDYKAGEPVPVAGD